MSTSVIVMDRSASGQTTREAIIELLTERVSVRELIEARVRQESLQRARRARNARSHGAATPPEEAHGVEAQCAQAVEAFERSQILVFLDERQLESLDEQIVLRPTSKVSFLKLVPLVGG